MECTRCDKSNPDDNKVCGNCGASLDPQRIADQNLVEYQLTEKGRDLTPAVIELTAWAERWLGEGASCDAEAAGVTSEARARNPLLLWTDRPSV